MDNKSASDNNNHNKFTYNAGSDWLEQSALSENKEHVDDVQLALKFCFGNLTNMT